MNKFFRHMRITLNMIVKLKGAKLSTRLLIAKILNSYCDGLEDMMKSRLLATTTSKQLDNMANIIGTSRLEDETDEELMKRYKKIILGGSDEQRK